MAKAKKTKGIMIRNEKAIKLINDFRSQSEVPPPMSHVAEMAIIKYLGPKVKRKEGASQ